MCIRVLAGIALRGKSESARVASATELLDRGWGKAPVTHTGADGEGDIRVTIRHILEDARDSGQAKVVDVVAIAKDEE